MRFRMTDTGLFDHDRIPTPNPAATDDRGVDADVALILLDRRTKDAGVFGEVRLVQGRHDAAGTGAGDAQADLGADRECPADPLVLWEAPPRLRWRRAPDSV